MTEPQPLTTPAPAPAPVLDDEVIELAGAVSDLAQGLTWLKAGRPRKEKLTSMPWCPST
jgi:hypothetical protein